MFHRKWVLPCWVTAILFKSWSSYFVILSAFLEYHSFHFNTVAFISKMNSSLLGCFVLGHLPNIIIKCECNGFLFFFFLWTRSVEWLFYHRVLYWFIIVSGSSLVSDLEPLIFLIRYCTLFATSIFSALVMNEKHNQGKSVSIYQTHSSHYQNMVRWGRTISPWRNHCNLYTA